jgi:hypothetical protein
VTVPYMMTLDAQWAVEDSLSGVARAEHCLRGAESCQRQSAMPLTAWFTTHIRCAADAAPTGWSALLLRLNAGFMTFAGEVDRMLSGELAPPPEPQSFREEVGKMFKKSVLGRSDRCADCPGSTVRIG